MALMVGELAATITVDDSGVTEGVHRAQSTMQAGGDAMVADADRAGQDAGQQLGDGLAEGAADGADAAEGAARSGFTKFKAAAAAAGLAAGAVLAAGLAQAMEQDKVADRMAAQLGATPAVAKRYGDIAGKLFAGAITEDFQGAADAVQETMRAGLLPPEATNAQIQSMSTRLADVASLLGEEVGPTARAVGQMIKTGMATDGAQALDILTRGVQTGDNAAGDLLDTFSEYSTQFRKLGLDGQMSMGLIQQGLKGGARDADTVADAIKEFSIRSINGSKTTVDGFTKIGLSADGMSKKIAAGGPAAAAALDQTLDKLRAVKDPAERSRLAVELFGTKAEDLGAALYSLDPSSAVQGLGKVGGAAKGAGDTLHNNASTRLTQFQRSLMQGLVGVLGTYVVPALDALAARLGTVGDVLRAVAGFVSRHSTAFLTAAGVITVVMLPTLITLAVTAATTAATVVAGWVTQSAAAVTSAARTVGANVMVIGGWVASAATAVASAAVIVAGWVLMGVQSLIRAGQMAAAWLIAMGPVGLIIAIVVGLVALIILNWDTIKNATIAVWDWVWGKVKAVASFIVDMFMKWTLVGIIISHWKQIKDKTAEIWGAAIQWIKGVPGMILNFFMKWTLAGIIISHWRQIKTGTVNIAMGMVDWVRGLPGRITAALGSLGNLLYSKGQDIVRGLWNGIKGMGGWLRSTLIGWAKAMIPGPIAHALGINSPSRVMRDQIGRHIPSGIVAGIEQGQGAVDAAMANLVSVPRGAGGLALGGVLGGGGVGPSAGGPARIVLDITGGDADMRRMVRRWVRIDGRGSVDIALAGA